MASSSVPSIILAVQWSNFGPFHCARLEHAANVLKSFGIHLIGMEMSENKNLFGWNRESAMFSFQKFTVLPGQVYENISPINMLKGVWKTLNKINPDVVAINGYSFYDAWGALIWCKFHKKSAVLMSDSNIYDFPRSIWKEWIKRQVVRQYNSALCAGSSQYEYLVLLGMNKGRISKGLDAIDNDYFGTEAQKARKNPASFRSLPGLENPRPYFLASARLEKSKNIDGLIKAYQNYRMRLSDKSGYTACRLVVIGEGVERAGLENFIRLNNIPEVSLPGFIQKGDLPAYYGLANVFVHPTYKDTWGLVVNEAMASGLPILVSERAGCVPDLVQEGKNGYSFNPNDLNSLTELMLLMSSEKVDSRKMGLFSQEIIKNWGLDRFSEGLKQAVQAAIS